MLYCYYTQLKVAIAVIDAAADFFAATNRLIVLSMGHALLGLIIIALNGSAAAYIYGMNDFKYDPNFGDTGQGRLPIWDVWVIVLLAIKTFAFLWALFFLSN